MRAPVGCNTEDRLEAGGPRATIRDGQDARAPRKTVGQMEVGAPRGHLRDETHLYHYRAAALWLVTDPAFAGRARLADSAVTASSVTSSARGVTCTSKRSTDVRR